MIKKILSVCIVSLLLLLAFQPVNSTDETVQITTTIYGVNGQKTVANEYSLEKTMEIFEWLKKLDDALKSKDETAAFNVALKLRDLGIIGDFDIISFLTTLLGNNDKSKSADNDSNYTLKNLLCLVFGFGNALFAYPIDFIAIFLFVFFLGRLPLGFIFVLVASLYWMMLSHLIPVRFFLPITLIGFNTGDLVTIGLNGKQTISREGNQSTIGCLVGFTGILINILYISPEFETATSPFFCLGTSLLAYEKVDSF